MAAQRIDGANRSTHHRGGFNGIRIRDDRDKCDAVRGRIVEVSNTQVGWGAKNRKALEPPDVAPTWVHYDVREYEPQYLRDEFFCQDPASLNNLLPIKV